MSRKQNRKRFGSGLLKWLVGAICLLLIVDAAMLFLINKSYEENRGFSNETYWQPEETEMPEMPGTEKQPTEPVETTLPAITMASALQFPYTLEDGKLNVETIFQYTGMNPDCNWEDGENIAGIQLVNTSEMHLSEATIYAFLHDGVILRFALYDVPAGARVTAFSADNTVLTDAETIADLSCEAVFVEESPLMQDALAVKVAGTAITVRNISDAPLSDLTVFCHGLLDTDIFGGLTYEYPIEHLNAGESITIDAWDCFLGDAAVVRIARDEP